MIISFKGKTPRIDPAAFIAAGAVVIGDVTIGVDASVWFNAVLRGDVNRIVIGCRSNIQDCTVLHVGEQEPCVVGDDVIVGHGVNLHGCVIEDRVLVGMGAIVLNGAVIGEGSLIGAGTLVPEGMRIPRESLVLGHPGRIIRGVRPDDIRYHAKWVREYVEMKELYKGAAAGQAARVKDRPAR